MENNEKEWRRVESKLLERARDMDMDESEPKGGSWHMGLITIYGNCQLGGGKIWTSDDIWTG